MTLKDTLGGMVRQANAKQGEVARVRLLHGLTISVKLESEDVISLQLSRANVYPSTQEWKTVIQQWPGQCAVIKGPKPLVEKAVYYLQGKIMMSPALLRERECGHGK